MLMAIDHDDFEKMSQLEGRGDQQIESYLVAMANSFDPLPGPLFLSLKNKAGVLFGETFTKLSLITLPLAATACAKKTSKSCCQPGNIAWDPCNLPTCGAGLKLIWFCRARRCNGIWRTVF
jgi:hypothetical protein